MSGKSHIELQYSSILNVPLDKYDNFYFIINETKYQTTRIVADLLSARVSNLHSTDPTINEIHIRTQHDGDFSHILQLVNFKETAMNNDELPFIIEIIEKLGNDKITINISDVFQNKEMTKDNVINNLKSHLKYRQFYSKTIENEIEFISSHLFEMIENNNDEMKELPIDILERIFSNSKIQLETEDQLLSFINELYSSNYEYSTLFEFVLFKNISTTKIKEFVKLFDIDDITTNIWKSITQRLIEEIQQNQQEESTRYKKSQLNIFSINPNDPFNGIIKHLLQESNRNIENKINITASKHRGSYIPQNVVLYEDDSKYYQSYSIENSFICFDFKEHQIIPTSYTIKSCNCNENSYHPKSWAIEVSNDGSNWEIIDERNNNTDLRGNHKIHTFPIQKKNKQKYQYFKIRQTAKNWGNDNDLLLKKIEIYGQLI